MDHVTRQTHLTPPLVKQLAADAPGVNVSYEITWERLADEAWVWERTLGLSFQGACRYGLSKAEPGVRRLISVVRLPDNYDPATGRLIVKSDDNSGGDATL